MSEGWINRYTYQTDHGNNVYTHTQSLSPQVFWDNVSESWRSLLLVNNTDRVNPHYLVRNSHITARIGISSEWEQEGVLYYDPDFTRATCAEYWVPQAHIGGVWVSLNTTFWGHSVDYNSTFINVTGTFRVYYGATEVGRMRISYILRPACFLKHEIGVVNITPQTRDFRVVMRLVGIAGTRIQHVLGETVVTLTEQQIESYWLRFVNNTNPKFVFLKENLHSLGHWGSNGTVWINDYIRAIRVKLVDYKGKSLVRCDIVIGNYTLEPEETLFIDPDTSSWQVSTGANDAVERGDGDFDSGDVLCDVFRHTSETADGYRCSGTMFDEVNIPQGATINSANVSGFGDYYKDPYFSVYCHDVGDSENFVDNPNIINQTERPRTTAYHSFELDDIGAGWYNFTATDAIQEVINRGDWSPNNNLTVLWIAHIGAIKYWRFKNYENYAGSSFAAKLFVTWSTGEEHDLSGDITRVSNIVHESTWSFLLESTINPVTSVVGECVSSVVKNIAGVVGLLWSIVSGGGTTVFNVDKTVTRTSTLTSVREWSSTILASLTRLSTVEGAFSTANLINLYGAVTRVYTLTRTSAFTFIREAIVNPQFTVESITEATSATVHNLAGVITLVENVLSERTWSFTVLPTLGHVWTVAGLSDIFVPGTHNLYGVIGLITQVLSTVVWPTVDTNDQEIMLIMVAVLLPSVLAVGILVKRSLDKKEEKSVADYL